VRGPECFRCHKRLTWEVPAGATKRDWRGRRTAGDVRAGRLRLLVYQRARRKLAIRCLWCLRLLCCKCAEKHFQPSHLLTSRVRKEVDRVVAEVVTAMRPKLIRCGKRAALRRRRS
jgi:hypothetical protein